MNQIAAITLSMSSAEIAEITGKQISHVNRDIISMASEIYPEMDNLDSVGIFINRKMMNGRSVIESIRLDRNNTECLVTGYSAVLRMKVIKRLRDLEEQSQPKLPQTFPEALRLAAELAEQNQALTAQITADAPKVDFHDRVAVSSGVLIGQFAKAVGTGERRLFSWLRANGYLISTAGVRHNTPYQKYVDSGHFEVTESPYETPSGEMRTSFTTHITGKGQVALTKKLRECRMIPEDVK